MGHSASRLVIIGAGPAGMAAAVKAHHLGLNVTLLDEYPRLGGQYYRGQAATLADGSPGELASHGSCIDCRLETSVFDIPCEGRLSIWSPQSGAGSLEYEAIIVATGAYDRPVPLPGWTLPGVVTAGGVLALVKSHGVLPGRRFLLSGSGPLLMPVADVLSATGAQVLVLDATPFRAFLRGLNTLVRDWPVFGEAAGYQVRLLRRGVTILYGRAVTSIEGDGRVQRATFQRVDPDWQPIPGSACTVEVDSVVLGFGLIPHLDLARLLGCEIAYDVDSGCHVVRVDAQMRTKRPAAYAAGETTGLSGARVAKLEGQLAALAAARDLGVVSETAYRAACRTLNRQLERLCRTARWFARTCRPRPGLWSLALADTVLCRCEEVRLRDVEASLVANSATPQAVKVATRAGMGLCQGKICSALIAEILQARYGYEIPPTGYPWSQRPPIRPVPVSDWAALLDGKTERPGESLP
jgi:NADPH-dependent 2,4-dienoyl-CoA reductase/sulfur reductase-like enzyme